MVFIQISLMNFSNHKKLLDIFESSKNFMSELKNGNHSDYFSYFKFLVQPTEIMLLFVSPQDDNHTLLEMERDFPRRPALFSKEQYTLVPCRKV